MTETEIRKAVNTPEVAYELGRLVGLKEHELAGSDWGVDEKSADSLWPTLAAQLLDTVENDRERRLRYITETLADNCDLEIILEPVVEPDHYEGGTRSSVAVALVDEVGRAGILDLDDWQHELNERARDAAIQAKIDEARGK